MIIRLAAADAAALLDVADLEPDLADAFARAGIEGLFLVLEVGPEEGAALLVAALNAALAAPDRRGRRRFKHLARKVEQQLARQGVEVDLQPTEFIATADEYNEQPQDELGGFSPRQIRDLLAHEWTPDGPGLRLRPAGGPDEVEESRTVHNARILLAALGKQGTRATATKGNLNRAFVTEMLGAMRWPGDYEETVRYMNKVFDEEDVWRLHELRVVLELAKLVARRKDRWRATPRGRELAAADRAAELHELLVRTTFRVFNLAYSDRWGDLEDFQQTVAFPLAVLRRLDDSWFPLADLAPRLLLPTVAEMLPPPAADPYRTRDRIVQLRLLRPLLELGLLEARWSVHERTRTRTLERVRKTPLYDRVFGLGCG